MAAKHANTVNNSKQSTEETASTVTLQLPSNLQNS
jgi:hypothetical protein